MSEHPEPSGQPEETAQEAERRESRERRSLIDLTRAERGEPERRRLPGVERRGPEDPRDVAAAAKLVGMTTNPEHFPKVPELETDEDVPPRPEEEIADADRD